MTTDEKRKLGAGLCHLSPEDLSKALDLVAEDNPSFQTTAEEVDLDMDAQVNYLYSNTNTAPGMTLFRILTMLSCAGAERDDPLEAEVLCEGSIGKAGQRSRSLWQGR